MICIRDNKHGAEILTDYCAGTLDDARAAELINHIRQCGECRKLVEAQQSVWEALGDWTPPEVSPDFDARLYARIAAEPVRPAWRQWLNRLIHPAAPRPLWKPLLPLAAAAAVLSLALFIQDPDVSTPPQKSAPSAQVRSGKADLRIDADQVEQALDDLELLAPAGQKSPI